MCQFAYIRQDYAAIFSGPVNIWKCTRKTLLNMTRVESTFAIYVDKVIDGSLIKYSVKSFSGNYVNNKSVATVVK